EREFCGAGRVRPHAGPPQRRKSRARRDHGIALARKTTQRETPIGAGARAGDVAAAVRACRDAHVREWCTRHTVGYATANDERLCTQRWHGAHEGNERAGKHPSDGRAERDVAAGKVGQPGHADAVGTTRDQILLASLFYIAPMSRRRQERRWWRGGS